MKNFEIRLKGGHPNSLGNTIEVVEEVLDNHSLFDELFNCYFSDDEIVRLRVSNAMKRICKENKELLIPYIPRFLSEISQINQASTQWTLANLFEMLDQDMNAIQINSAKSIIKNNLMNHSDWIVLNNSMETLAKWSKNDQDLKEWLKPILGNLKDDKRKSVSKRAGKLFDHLLA